MRRVWGDLEKKVFLNVLELKVQSISIKCNKIALKHIEKKY